MGFRRDPEERMLRVGALRSLPEMSSRHGRLMREGAWVTVGQVATAAGMLAGTRLITEFVPPEIYGSANLLLGIALLARNIFCTPALNAALRFHPEVARTQEVWRLRRVIRAMLNLTTAFLVLCLASAGAVYAWWQGTSAVPFLLLGVVLIFEVGINMETHLWIAARRQRAVSISMTCDALLRPLLVVAAAVLLGATASSVILAYAMGYMIIYAGSVLLAQREGTDAPPSAQSRGALSESPALVRQVLLYAIPLMPLALMKWVTSLSDRYVVGALLSMEDVGVYTAAFQLMSYPFLIGYGTVSRTLTPIYNAAVSHGNHRRANRVFWMWLAATVLIGVLGLGLTLLLREWVTHTFLAQKYHAGVSLMPWIALGYCVYAVAWVFEKKLYANKQTVRLAVIHTIVAVAAVAAPVALIWPFGLRGVAMGCAVHFAVMAVLTVALSRSPARPMVDEAEEEKTAAMPGV